MSQCKPNILVEDKHFNIAQCSCCQRIGLYYHNLLVGFNFKDFITWADSVLKVDFTKNAYLFPDGEMQLIINTCHQDIQFAFTKKEFLKLKEGLSQALLILEAQNLVNQKKN